MITTAIVIAIVSIIVTFFYLNFAPKPVGVDQLEFLARYTNVSTNAVIRLAGCIVFQSHASPRCGDGKLNDLKNHFILVTGGNKGIGFETVRGLVKRGANVVIAARDTVSSKNAVERIKTEFSLG